MDKILTWLKNNKKRLITAFLVILVINTLVGYISNLMTPKNKEYIIPFNNTEVFAYSEGKLTEEEVKNTYTYLDGSGEPMPYEIIDYVGHEIDLSSVSFELSRDEIDSALASGNIKEAIFGLAPEGVEPFRKIYKVEGEKFKSEIIIEYYVIDFDPTESE